MLFELLIMFYVVGCEYIDDDGDCNMDNVAGVFTTMDDAIAFKHELINHGCWHISIDQCDQHPLDI